ncbi:hypothetical protein MSAN_00778700 [Mycena sanguinolenta]|uniref:Uncharacterized protein n=1 Tax=Mycena sanguinolenta TaxID=230812 RepID=A0A8H6Z6D7_9AGAR|nr:hypothetical protein MSAN_00778700 [Mycena sanguinolenta]
MGVEAKFFLPVDLANKLVHERLRDSGTAARDEIDKLFCSAPSSADPPPRSSSRETESDWRVTGVGRLQSSVDFMTEAIPVPSLWAAPVVYLFPPSSWSFMMRCVWSLGRIWMPQTCSAVAGEQSKLGGLLEAPESRIPRDCTAEHHVQ